MPPKKKFIDKKNAVTFRLVHRSQRDPLVADERAPKHVLLDFSRKEEVSAKKRKEEQKKYGVYFDDDYNYLQHLKDVSRVAYWEPVSGKAPAQIRDEFANEQALQLPSSVFQSSVEESEGLLNKAAPRKGPRPDWDPDVLAALDDDFDFNDPSNELDDDFVVAANAECGDKERDVSDEDDNENSSFSDHSFGEEETKSHFTNYSMSSSVISRNKGLQTLDERFEKLYELYEEDEIGALDGEEIAGFVKTDSSLMQNLVKEFEEQKQDRHIKDIIQKSVDVDLIRDDDSSDEELVKIIVDESKKEDQWDCESILSNCSNLYNHPKLIIEPKQKKKIEVSGRTGLPKDVLRPKGLKQSQLKQLDESSSEDDDDDENKTTVSTVRLPNETPEQRCARKAVVRQFRKERRIEKKMNKQAFKLEEQRQTQVIKNLKQNLQGLKLV